PVRVSEVRHGPPESRCAAALGQAAVRPNIEGYHIIQRRLGRAMPLIVGFLDLVTGVRNVAAPALLPVRCALSFLHHLQFSNQDRCDGGDMKISSLYLVGLQVERVRDDLVVYHVDWMSQRAYRSDFIHGLY